MTKKNNNEETNITEFSSLMQKSYIDYALSVIIDRALPDIRDGLKPVQRRILYDLFDLKVFSSKQHKKSARIVGDTMGRFHPHGDSSIYGALINLSQDFRLNNPLIDIHGNNGSIDGDPPAAMRYTETRLSEFGDELVKNINDKLVEFQDNYDNTEKEPKVIPTLIPNVLLSGASGIAVGMKTEIPTHNLGELLDAIIAYMGNKKITTKELLNYVKGPDYPTGGIITNKKELLNLYETGVGKVTIRAKIEKEKITPSKTNLVITEIPYSFSGNKIKLLEHIIQLMKDKKLEEISELTDESSDKIRIVIELKRGVDVDKFIKKLYAKTKLEDSISYNFLVVKDKEPVLISLKNYIEEYLAFQNENYKKYYNWELSKKEKRLEILEGLKEVYDKLDAVIETIRFSKSIATAKKCLMTGDISEVKFKTKKLENIASKFKFTQLQAQTILEMRLQQLNNLEILELDKELKQITKDIAQIKKILSSQRSLNNVIKKDILSLKEKFHMKRRTKISDVNELYVEEKEEIIEEDLQILVDRFGYIKTVDLNSISKAAPETLAQYRTSFVAKNTDKLFVFTNKGTLYQCKINDLPKLKLKEKGVILNSLFNMEKDEKIMLITSMNNYKNIYFVFNNGYIKNVKMVDYESRQRKTIATMLYQSEILNIIPINKEKVITIEFNGKKNNIDVKNIPECKKNVKGIKILK